MPRPPGQACKFPSCSMIPYARCSPKRAANVPYGTTLIVFVFVQIKSRTQSHTHGTTDCDYARPYRMCRSTFTSTDYGSRATMLPASSLERTCAPGMASYYSSCGHGQPSWLGYRIVRAALTRLHCVRASRLAASVASGNRASSCSSQDSLTCLAFLCSA